MKNKKNKELLAWIILFILIISTLTLTYLKFFSKDDTNIQEIPINESSSNAIHTALKEITTNFNKNPKVVEYNKENNINLKASVNNFSIYISYISDTTTTYEFTYDNLCLNISIDNTKESKTKFNIIYKFLVEAVQQRINNTDNIDDVINTFLSTEKNYDGLTKKEFEKRIEYQINITKKLKEN